MPRKLKTFITNLGFFELAIAAPSMKAALEAWGMRHNAFQKGFAKETDDTKIVAATMEKPGVVLRRPVGTHGPFLEGAALPKDWSLEPLKSASRTKRAEKPEPKQPVRKEPSKQEQQAVILSFEKAKRQREAERREVEAREAAKQERARVKREGAVAEADAALKAARKRHEAAMAKIQKQRDKLERRAGAEKSRWDKERDRLDEARKRAGQ